ncbi:MAG TPA: hypothetical protein VEK08_23425 [Planctomycetota bacterium]|nr:hypothetical protein [Planctomycetota bacterium]
MNNRAAKWLGPLTGPYRSFGGLFGAALLAQLFLAASAFCGEALAENAALSPEAFSAAFSTRPGQPWKVSSELCAPRRAASTAPDGWDLRAFGSASVQALRENAGAGVVRLRWAVSSRAGFYLSATAAVVPTASPATISVSIAGDSPDLVPSGHQRPWDELAASQVTAIELRPETTFPANIAAAPIPVVLSKASLAPAAPAVKNGADVLDLSLEAAPESRGGAVLVFRIEPPPADPFSPDGDGDVRVIAGGKQCLAFFDQEFIETDDGAATRAMPVGRPFWRAYLPDSSAGTAEIISGQRRWKVSLPQAAPKKQAGLEHSAAAAPTASERWHVPLEVPFPDMSELWRGLPGPSQLSVHGHWQQRNGQGGGTLWRPVPFWNGAWGEFNGALRPNLVLARKMDQLLAQAAHAGKSIPLAILDGEMFDRSGTFNWSSHPLKGVLAGPGELYRHPRGWEFARRSMRYCIARWASSRAVGGLWLTGTLHAPGCSEFHARLAPQLNAWTRDLGLGVYSLHPFANAPEIVQRIASFEPGERGTWRGETRQNYVYLMNNQEGSDGRGLLEVRTMDVRSKTLGVVENFLTRITDWKSPCDNFFAADALAFDAWIPPHAPPDLRVGIHVRDRDGNWYETLLHGMPTPGDWRSFIVDISERNAHELKGINHTKPWTGYSRQRLIEIGIHFYSTHAGWTPKGQEPMPLEARIDHVRAVRVRPESVSQAPVITLLRAPITDAAALAVGELLEFHFTVNKIFANPFDAADCDLAALITTPSGKQLRVPAFFNQNCRRREAKPGGDEIVEPDGAEFFTVRYRVTEAGMHQVSLELREGGKYEITERARQADDRFTAQGKAQEPSGRGGWGRNFYNRDEGGWRPVEKIRFKPGTVTASLKLEPFTASPARPERKFRGFMRVAADRRHFQHEDGSFFYPIGPCLRSPSDTRIPYNDAKYMPESIDAWSRRGTYQYDLYLSAFEKAGINWARMWMCSWWGGLEWRRDWPGFQGVGRYNLLNAWRVDYVIARCEQRGIWLDLCLTNHGQFSLNVDTEWRNNPYGARLGGPLTAASEFFTLGEAKIAHQNKLRYCVARFGHSPAILAWSLFSELEWTEEYEPSFRWGGLEDLPAPNIEAWHTEMAEYVRSIDVNRHLITTHYSHPTRGEGTLRLPVIDFATSNAYSAFEEFRNQGMQYNASYALSAFWSGIPNSVMKGFKIFDKPALVEEQGRHWGGGRHNMPKEALEADLHCGLWGSIVQPLAGATGYWWWLHLHYDNKYGEYKALANFVAGEDFRPAADEAPFEPLVRGIDSPDGNLLGRAMKSDRRLYLWIHHQRTPYGDHVPDCPGGKLKVGSLKPGAYTIEFWNTYTGEIIEQRAAKVELIDGKPSSIDVDLPVVKRDIAVKIKPVGK